MAIDSNSDDNTPLSVLLDAAAISAAAGIHEPPFILNANSNQGPMELRAVDNTMNGGAGRGAPPIPQLVDLNPASSVDGADSDDDIPLPLLLRSDRLGSQILRRLGPASVATPSGRRPRWRDGAIRTPASASTPVARNMADSAVEMNESAQVPRATNSHGPSGIRPDGSRPMKRPASSFPAQGLSTRRRG